MSDVVTLYHNPMSRGRTVRWMLEEIGAKYEVKLLSFDKKEHKSAEYLAVNPMGKIPTLVHRGTVVTESAAICAYLADAFPAAKLAPAVSDPSRGTYFRWLFFGPGCVEPATVDKLANRPKVERPGMIGYGTYEDTMNALERALTPGPYVLGGQFSAADVYLASALWWGMMMKGIEARPVFQSYVERCRDRPAAKRAAALDDELIAKAKAAP